VVYVALTSALFGTSRVDYATGAAIQEAGFFSEHTEEVDLKHVDAVVFFSQRYVARARHVVVHRTVRIFARPKLDWRRRAMLLLWGWIFGWSRKVSVYQPNV
jgi:hypothetical protein